VAVDSFISDSGKYLICLVNEPVTLEVIYEMIRQLNKLADETGINSRMIDTRGMPNMVSVVANYDLAYKDMDEMNIDRSTKVAALRLADEGEGFAMTAIKNAGFNLRSFVDEAEAIAWLENDQER
jgi:hypothetical protein